MNRPDIRRLPKRINPLEAQKHLLKSVCTTKLQIESGPLVNVLGRILAKDVFSDVAIPSYDKTFIDGYAINPQRTKTPQSTRP